MGQVVVYDRLVVCSCQYTLDLGSGHAPGSVEHGILCGFAGTSLDLDGAGRTELCPGGDGWVDPLLCRIGSDGITPLGKITVGRIGDCFYCGEGLA